MVQYPRLYNTSIYFDFSLKASNCTEQPPALSPNNVMLFESPPNSDIFLCTHFKASNCCRYNIKKNSFHIKSLILV